MAEEHFNEATEMCGTATSTLDVQAAITWLEGEKAACLPIDVDVRDAKRRISLVKGPKKKAAKKRSSKGDSSDSA